MRVIENPSQQKEFVEKLIREHGNAPWHNFQHFQNWEGTDEKNVVLHFERRGAILARRKNHTWNLFSEILASSEFKLDLFQEFLDFCFKDPSIDKVSLEVESDFRGQILTLLRNSPWRACRPKYDLTCSIFDLAQWEEHPGDKTLKKLHKQVSSFYKKHRVEIVDTNQCTASDLKRIVQDWGKNRHGIDREYFQPYFKSIENHFAGTRFRRTFIVDGIPSTITAGWDIPNQESSYYSAFGIHNYRYDYLGEASYFDDLFFLKSQGIRFADFGGGWGGLLRFKLKFKPSIFYVTYAFSIKRTTR